MTKNLFQEFDKITAPSSTENQAPKTETTATENPKVETPKTETTKEDDKQKVIKSVFGDFAIGQKEETETIDTQGKFFDKLKKETGMEIKAFDDVFKLINDPNKVSKDKLEQVELQVKEYDTFFSSMPTDLHAIISDYYNQKDYKETMKKMIGSVDFSKPVSSYTNEQLILMYNPDISEDEISDMTEREASALYKAAKIEYEKEHKEIINKAEQAKKIQFESAKQYVSSIDASIEQLKEQMPNLGKDKIEQIKQKMIQGYSLYDKNVYRQDAAYRIAMAEYGKDFVQQIIDEAAKIIQRKIEQAQSQTKEALLKEKTNDALHKTSRELPPADATEQVRTESMPFLKPPKPKKQ